VAVRGGTTTTAPAFTPTTTAAAAAVPRRLMTTHRSFGKTLVCKNNNNNNNSHRIRTLVSIPSLHNNNNHYYYDLYPQQKQRQQRYMSSSSWLPEALSSYSLPSIWGGSGYILKALHMDNGTTFLSLGIPYGACFAILSIVVRCALFPLVLQGAHTSARFAKVVPEIQFLMTLFTNDWKQLRQRKDSTWVEKYALLRTNFQTLSALYKLHNIRPLAVFYSPLLQLPIFWYVPQCQ
jgi:membrane protein insertase Oxa1/YidC/SpoIIIJ